MILATYDGDIDYYVSLRSVCRAWRAATYDPCGSAPCFRPYGWAMLGALDRDASGDRDSRRLFLNVNTGRFMWKDMPMLHGRAADACLAADDTNGLLVLKSAADSEICVLNPFTGYDVAYGESWDSFARRTVRVQVGGSPTRELYTFGDSCHVVRNRHGQEDLDTFSSSTRFAARVSFHGYGACIVDERGYVEDENPDRRRQMRRREMSLGRPSHGQRFCPSEDKRSYRETRLRPLDTFLVDSDDEVLLVRLWTSSWPSKGHNDVQVFWVNQEDKYVDSIRSIGDHAIFLGNRCLSVNASNLPGIKSNCIYYIGDKHERCRGIYTFCLKDGSHQKLFEPSLDQTRLAPALPLSLLEILLDYPKYRWKLGSPCPTWQY
jgi:hypothetical protein